MSIFEIEPKWDAASLMTHIGLNRQVGYFHVIVTFRRYRVTLNPVHVVSVAEICSYPKKKKKKQGK